MNNTPKNFYVLYPKDKKIKDTLNAIKILSDNSQRTAAHITVRGACCSVAVMLHGL
jgi:uncharacterized radical SAM superfamily protein